eukprot:g3097.t1
MDNTATFSVTDERTADQITEKAISLVGGVKSATDFTVVDLTACVGGNVLSFAKRFSRVLAIEFDVNRAEMLSHNIHLLENADKARRHCEIRCQQGDSVQLLSDPARMRREATGEWTKNSHAECTHLLFFLDPPWGGLNYKEEVSLPLTLGSRPIADVLRMCLNVPGCAHVILKCPFNTDMSGIDSLMAESGGRCRKTLWSLSKRVKCVVISVTATAKSPDLRFAKRQKVAPRAGFSSWKKGETKEKDKERKKKTKRKKKKKKKNKRED